MHLREGEYDKAHTDFFEAFKVSLIIMNCYCVGYIFSVLMNQ